MSEAALMTRPLQPATGLAAEAAEFAPWFHNLHLPDGGQTAPNHPLGDFPSFKWKQIAEHLPRDLSGWTALDLGCNAGFYTVELARRGARVTALDMDRHFLRQARWAVEKFHVAHLVEFREAQVYELARWSEQFDLVLFMGVFYHLRYPLLALDLVTEKVKRLMVFQTLTMPGTDTLVAPPDLDIYARNILTEPGWPKMAFIENSIAGDPTNWWAPNHAGVEAMLRSSGLEVSARPGHEIYLCQPAAGANRPVRSWNQDELLIATGRPPREAGP